MTGGVDLEVTTAGTIVGRSGIDARNAGGTGAVTVVANGHAEGMGLNGIGINVRNSPTGNGLSVTSQSATGVTFGIAARNYGGGTFYLDANGHVEGTAATSIGVYARTNGTGLNVETESVTGGNYGIRARNEGIGALDIVANGDVEGTGANSIGIYGRNFFGTSLSVTSQGVTGGNFGIFTRNDGNGALEITANGDVEGTLNIGIFARNYGTDLSIESEGITGGNFGINARNYGNGALGIVATGAVEGTAADGIYAFNSNAGTSLSIETASVTGGFFRHFRPQ